ncbi:hypothetical protein VTK56DRAFT_4338 [Thermocarpiscus australiensis]
MQQALEQLHAKVTQLETENGVLQQVINAVSSKPKSKAKMEPPEKQDLLRAKINKEGLMQLFYDSLKEKVKDKLYKAD